jgi:hypothetical protein
MRSTMTGKLSVLELLRGWKIVELCHFDACLGFDENG